MQKLLLAFVSFMVLNQAETAMAQLIVAHRGASHDAPENTLAAFELAWEQNADAVEGDFFLTKDQQIVCIHDGTTRRVAPKQRELTVANSTLKELQQLDVGSWKHPRYAGEHIPTLKEVLATVPSGKQILVEVKCGPEILPLLQRELKTSGLSENQIVIICFNRDVVSQARQLMPEYDANWLTSYKQNKLTGRWKPSRDEVLKTLYRCGATGLGTNGHLTVVDRSFADSIREAGFQLHVWTVNDADAAKRFADFGASSITTDRPKFIRDAIEMNANKNREPRVGGASN